MSPLPSAWKWWAALCGALAMTLLVSHACQPDPTPVLEDTRWRDSLHVSQVRWEQDSAMREEAARAAVGAAQDSTRRALRLAETYRRKARWADSVLKVPASNFNSASGDQALFDSVVPRVAYDSLWSAYETADSTVQVLHGAIRQYIMAASRYAEQAVAAEGRLSQERAIYEGRITDLTTALRKQTRGCRVVGFIPCPQLSVGYGAMLTGGQVRVGPTVTVSIPVRF